MKLPRFASRLLEAALTLWLLLSLCFVLLRLAPGGPFDGERAAPPEIEAALAQAYRLDAPLWQQYLDWFGGLLRGDLGPSFTYPDKQVGDLILQALPVTLLTGGLALLLAVPAFMGSSASDHSSAQWWGFIGVAAGMAVVASVLGNAFWNRASRLLPLTMIGQMILFETLFALLYGFLWEARWPTALEALAMVLVSASVLAGISAHQPHQPAPEHGN